MIQFVEREMTEAEYARELAGFDEHTLEHSNPSQTSERYTVVALDRETFIGCASGLAYKNGDAYNGWFYLTDLFVEKPYRKQGLGAAVLSKLEARIAPLGIRQIWTMTAGYEAPGFYRKQGYEVIFEHENWYATGHGQVGLQKRLTGNLLPTSAQREKICDMIHHAFVELRFLSRARHSEQAADLADAFHNISKEMYGWGKFSWDGFRSMLEGYQSKWGSVPTNYVAMLDKIREER